MESKKKAMIRNSILLPQKEKKFTRHTRYINDAYIKIYSPHWNDKESRRLRGVGGGGRGERSGGLGAWCRGRWFGGLNYFAAKNGLIAMHQYKLEM